MLHNPIFSYDGKYWKLKEAVNMPQPVQKPFRVSVGARQPRMIKITAKYADGINSSGNLQNIYQILEKYHENLEKLGKKVDDVFISGFAPSVYLLKNAKEYEDTLQKWKQRGSDINIAREYSFIGTADVLVDKWRKAMDLGMKMSVINVRPSSSIEENAEKLAHFKDEVASQL
jgi:alkanesulfonate monooxygenase SsuD/methylene tetrahydromethanopterin reductase-like flavin-dependent oxidoreductase (luciferase family)